MKTLHLTKYHDLFNIKKKQFLFNTYNGALINLDPTALNHYTAVKNTNSISSFTNDEFSILRTNGFILSSSEEQLIEEEIVRTYISSKYTQKNTLKIDVPISNICNFICPYCFERDSLEIQKNKPRLTLLDKENFKTKLHEYLQKSLTQHYENIEAVWYGGEPLTEPQFMCELNHLIIEFCKKNNKTFSNIIITNGYLFNSELLDLISQQNIKYVQITLDGDKETHNMRRTTMDHADTFTIIIQNIQKLLEKNIEVVIRVNVDKNNYSSIPKLIQTLQHTFDNHYFGVKLFLSFGRVFGSAESFTLSEYELRLKSLYLEAARHKLVAPNLSPPNSAAFCSAETQNYSITVDVFGSVYKCWNDVFNTSESICQLSRYDPFKSDINLSPKNYKYLHTLSLNNINNGACLKCQYYRFCKGFCPNIREKILANEEENIYNDQICQKVIHQRLETLIHAYLIKEEIL